jgi:hypothetical protein
MRSAPLGRSARGVVCLVAARRRGQRPVGRAPGRPMRHAGPSLPPVWGLRSLSLSYREHFLHVRDFAIIACPPMLDAPQAGAAGDHRAVRCEGGKL